jgi:hypothetical protein
MYMSFSTSFHWQWLPDSIMKNIARISSTALTDNNHAMPKPFSIIPIVSNDHPLVERRNHTTITIIEGEHRSVGKSVVLIN